MADRTDIDALLIGALYGELTPADEARLTAHLESHPADRTALSDLTRTRAAIRDSRIFAFQWEPPHSVSALLLQEASRRAPRPARALDGDSESWFARFVRSFTAHPAMAAAATLVLVFGVAGSLYLRGSMKMAPPPVAVTGGAADEPAAEVPVAAPAAAPAAPTGRADLAEDKAADRREAAGSAAPSSGQAAGGLDVTADDKLDARPGDIAQFKAKTRTADVDAKRAALAKPAKEEEPARTKPRGIELRTPEPSPKDLPEREFDGTAKLDQKRAERQVRERQAPGGGAAAPATAAQATPPPPPPPQTPPSASTAFESAPVQDVANDKRFAQKPLAKGQAQNQAPANNGASNNASNNAPAADGKPVDSQSRTLDWARKQREQVVSLVNQNRCNDAANAAIEIYNRAPDYYAANIVTDIQIKPCLAYVNRQRERNDRSRNTVKNASDALPDPVPSRK
jgi:hypothetical protein